MTKELAGHIMSVGTQRQGRCARRYLCPLMTAVLALGHSVINFQIIVLIFHFNNAFGFLFRVQYSNENFQRFVSPLCLMVLSLMKALKFVLDRKA